MYGALVPSYTQPLEEGTVAFERFHLYLPLGSGSSAVVWEAQDLATDRRVALKILHTPGHVPATAFRAQLEARALRSIRHPHVVMAEDFGVFDGGVWIAMEIIDGPTLRDAVVARAHELESSVVFAVGRPLLHALAAVHAAGFVHRDLKPSNIILRDGRWEDPVLLDFGVVRAGDTPFT
ncbi:MAG: protein kinase [Myxococcota bacterium]